MEKYLKVEFTETEITKIKELLKKDGSGVGMDILTTIETAEFNFHGKTK